jgi:hypothetical protein
MVLALSLTMRRWARDGSRGLDRGHDGAVFTDDRPGGSDLVHMLARLGPRGPNLDTRAMAAALSSALGAIAGFAVMLDASAHIIAYYGGGSVPPSSPLGGGWRRGGMFICFVE